MIYKRGQDQEYTAIPKSNTMSKERSGEVDEKELSVS
jgi:hypothetical protein